MSLCLVTAMRSVTGPHRSNNQDSAGASDSFLFVADGVGGHAGGDVASWTVTHRLMALLATTDVRTLDTDRLCETIAITNADLYLRIRRDPLLVGMATTFTGLFLGARTVRVAHIGDSRAYLVRDGEGRRVSRDDSLVQMLVDQGSIDPAEAEHHPHRNIILKSLSGSYDDPQGLTLLTLRAQPGDRWLVASDGLTDYIPDPIIIGTLADSDPDSAVETLVQAALDAGSRDNITVAVGHVVARDGHPVPSAHEGSHVGAAASGSLGYIGRLQ